nr:unnamed protein product [Spirometra erinaceieuropaei]
MARISVGRTSRSAGTGPFQDPKQVPPQAGPFIPGPPMGGSAMRHGPPLLGGPLGPAYPLPPRGPVNVSGCPPPGPMSLGPARAPPSPWWRGPLGPPPQHPSGYPSPGDPAPFRPRHFSPVPPPPGPRYPPPPPESFSTGFVPAQPFPPFPAPYSAAETGLFPDLVEDSPQLRYLRQICAGLRSACVSALVATLRSLRHEELFRVVYWQLHCFSPTDVEELKEAVVDAVFASQASSGAQLLEFLLDLSCIPLGESAPESEVQARASLQFASRSILKAICNRAWQRLTTSRLPSLEEDGRDDQGFFEALDLLTTSSAPISSLLTNFSGGGLLMHRLISNSCQASGRLLILHSVARNPGLAEIIFSNLICWEERPDSPHDNACPLLYFFPLILEWESVSISYSSAVAEVSQSALSRGVSPGEKLLRRVLERILFRGPEIAWLRNLLWLTRRELALSGGVCGRSAPSPSPPFRLLPALATLLPRLISLLPCGPISDDAVDGNRGKNMEVISTTLDLIHLALNHRCRNIPDSRPTASPLCFAPRESVTMGCRLMDALVNLLNRIEDLRSLDSLPGLLSLLVRCQDLLQKLTNADHLICSAALTTLAQSAVSRLTASHTSTQRPLSVTAPAEALKHAEPVNLPKDFFFEPSEMGGGRNDWKHLTSPKGENLLLSSPPSLVPDIVPRVGLPPATNRRIFTVSPPKEHDDWLPVWRLWTNMVGRLLRPQTSETPDDGNIYWQRRHLLGQALEDALLPLGARLPQTSISTLPTPLLLVTQPTGTGLERTLRLLRLFLPDRVNGVQGSIGGRREDNSRRILWGLLELVVSHTDTISSLPVGGDEAAKTPTEVAPSTAAPAQLRPLSLWPQTPQPLFPLVRVVIGLLAGLEVSWASSLAPKIPFRGLPSPASSDPNDPTSPVQIALGVFPLLGLPEVSRARVNKLLVDFSHRRVDPSSPLYRATAFLLSLILPICHFGDVRLAADMLAANSATARNGGEECGGSQPTQPLPALEPLLSRLTPRELAAALSDIRRSLRLRAGFDWFHRTSLARSPAPPPPPPNPPPFITPGLLIALGQSHLMETPGIPDAFGGLLRSMLLCQFRAPTVSGRIAAIFDRRECDVIAGSGGGGGGAPGANGADNEAARERESSAEPLAEGLEEIDVDGEMMIVIDS